MRSGLGEKAAIRPRSFGLDRVWGKEEGRPMEDSLILLSPELLSGRLTGISTVARLPPLWGLFPKGDPQICCEDESEGVDMGVSKGTAPGTRVMSNQPLITPSFVTLASSIVCSWVLLRAWPNSSTTFAALITLPSMTVDKSPGAGDRRVGGGIGAWSTSRPTPERMARIPRMLSSNNSLSRRVLIDKGSSNRDL